MLRLGEVLQGRYEILRPIGRGGFSFVYLARDRFTGDEIAVKEMVPPPIDERLWLHFFRREGRIGLRLQHPRIIKAQELFEWNASYCLAMEYAPGGSLADWLRREDNWSLDEAVRLGLECAEGLAYAHSQGIVHCDIKPTNILLDADQHVKISDFGLAHVASELGSSSWRGSSDLVAGTLYYMAPEQLRGERSDPRIDVYALGATLYQLLTGTSYLDFEQKSTPEAHANNIQKIKTQRPRPLVLDRSGQPIPDELRRIVLRCLAKQPRERFYEAGQIYHALLIWQTNHIRQTNHKRIPAPEPSYLTNIHLDRVALLMIFLTALLGTGLWAASTDLLPMVESLIAALITPVVWGAIGIALLVPAGFAWGWRMRPLREMWTMGWLLMLNLAAVGVSIQVIPTLLTSSAFMRNSPNGSQWLHLIYWFPILALLGLLTWLILRGIGWVAPLEHHSEIWMVVTGWFSGYFGTMVAQGIQEALASVVPQNSPLEHIAQADPLLLLLTLLVVLVSLGLLLNLRLRHWLILSGLTLLGSVLVLFLIPTLKINADSRSVDILILLVSSAATAIGFTAGIAIAQMERTWSNNHIMGTEHFTIVRESWSTQSGGKGVSDESTSRPDSGQIPHRS